MPYERFSRLETTLLRTHAHRTGGHSHWDVQTARALKDAPGNWVCSCAELGCPASCQPTGELQVVELMNAFPSTQLLREPNVCAWLGSFMASMSYKDHVRYMPHWLRRSMTPSAQAFVIRHIIPKCTIIDIAYAFYYECKLYEDPVYKDLSKMMLHAHPIHTKDFVFTDSLVQYVNEIVQAIAFRRLPRGCPTSRTPWSPRCTTQ